MTILFKNARLTDNRLVYLSVSDRVIAYIGEERPEGDFDREIDCRGNLLMPGLYNTHCHAAMTLFRGYGEDMPLDTWLTTRIYPAEDRLTPEKVRVASELAIAEMIRGGIVSFSDMYFFCNETAEAVIASGIKANLSRSLVSFDPAARIAGDSRFAESVELVKRYHGAAEGRLKIDMSLHAEYTNVEGYIRDVAAYTRDAGLLMQIHLSETEKEHNECIGRHGKTPTAFLADCGVFDAPATCAHGVWLTDDDMAVLASKGASVAHNPCSNLKLGSGVANITKMCEMGVNVTLGTDGAASNNALDLFREIYTASLLAKGTQRDPSLGKAGDILKMATENGAFAQRREKAGKFKVGYAADIVMLSLDSLNTLPTYDASYTAVYSASSRDVLMTVVDGKILYENGEFTTLDIERIKDDFKRVCDY